MKSNPPKTATKFFCIINRDEANLAALILSYIDQSEGYIPTFEFPLSRQRILRLNQIKKFVINTNLADQEQENLTLKSEILFGV